MHADAVLEGMVLFTKHLDGHVVFHTEHSTWLLHVHVLLRGDMYSASKNLSNVLNILIVLYISQRLLRSRICN